MGAMGQGVHGIDRSGMTPEELDRLDRIVEGIEYLDALEPQAEPPLWVPSSPIQNPYSEAKRVLGKILFWDEQLSSDSTVSCGTCHIPSDGGGDPRDGVNPGFDGLFNTPDDVNGSFGVVSMDEMDVYLRSELFGLERQVTTRTAPTNLMGMFSSGLFWDGRAELNFTNPETGDLIFQSGVAGLEIQAPIPILSEVEMGHAGRTWDQVRDRLARVRPMALGDSIPQDMLDAIEDYPSYPELFEEAFGDSSIDAVRIAFALATYQRTLVPDQSPWDLWNGGDANAMTQDQIDGYGLLQGSTCNFCHQAPTFANSTFFVDGVRPPAEDPGRMNVTGNFSDRGAFRVPSIRNVGIRSKLMHTGGLGSVQDILDFYGHKNGRAPFPENLSGFVAAPIRFSAVGEEKVKDFIQNGLTDPRVANETFPFDRPVLYSELAPNPEVLSGGQTGSGGFVPLMIAVTPPHLGNESFKIGVDFALGGAQAWVAISQSPPTDGVVASDELIGPIALSGMGNGGGYGTLAYPIPDDLSLDGTTMYMQWLVSDPAGNGGDGFIRSPAAKVGIFCSEQIPCVIDCVADFNGDGLSDFIDISLFISAFTSGSSQADLNSDGFFDFLDISAFITALAAGCP